MFARIKTFLNGLLWNDIQCIDVVGLDNASWYECRLIREEGDDYIVSFSDPLSTTGRPQRYRISKKKALSKPYTIRQLSLLP